VILQALEDDDAVARRLDLLLEDPELGAEAEFMDLRLEQPLARLRQRLLHLADADCERAFAREALLDQQLAKEVRLARAAAAEGCLVSRVIEQRAEHPRRPDFQCAQRSPA
jgi:hypothetical protein